MANGPSVSELGLTAKDLGLNQPEQIPVDNKPVEVKDSLSITTPKTLEEILRMVQNSGVVRGGVSVGDLMGSAAEAHGIEVGQAQENIIKPPTEEEMQKVDEAIRSGTLEGLKIEEWSGERGTRQATVISPDGQRVRLQEGLQAPVDFDYLSPADLPPGSNLDDLSRVIYMIENTDAGLSNEEASKQLENLINRATRGNPSLNGSFKALLAARMLIENASKVYSKTSDEDVLKYYVFKDQFTKSSKAKTLQTVLESVIGVKEILNTIQDKKNPIRDYFKPSLNKTRRGEIFTKSLSNLGMDGEQVEIAFRVAESYLKANQEAEKYGTSLVRAKPKTKPEKELEAAMQKQFGALLKLISGIK